MKEKTNFPNIVSSIYVALIHHKTPPALSTILTPLEPRADPSNHVSWKQYLITLCAAAFMLTLSQPTLGHIHDLQRMTFK